MSAPPRSGYVRVVRASDAPKSPAKVAAPRGVGAELQALRDEMHDERVRAYDRELVLWSELARVRAAWKAALVPRVVVQDPEPVMQPERARALELYSIAALEAEEVAKLHGLGAKGAIR